MAYEESFTELMLECGTLRVTWEYIGEGWSGDYNADDNTDIPLLRFTVSRYEPLTQFIHDYNNGYEQLDNGSYCTAMPINTSFRLLVNALGVIMEAAKDSLENGTFKKRMEELSWLCPADFNKGAQYGIVNG